MRIVLLSICTLFMYLAGLNPIAFGQQPIQEWFRSDLGTVGFSEFAGGIALDPLRNVYITGTTTDNGNGEDGFKQPNNVHNPIDDPTCVLDVYGQSNQVYWKFPPSLDVPPAICRTPFVLATCNMPDDGLDNEGSANDLVVDASGDVFLTGSCHLDTLANQSTYLRKFNSACVSQNVETVNDSPNHFFAHAIARHRNLFVYIVGTYEHVGNNDRDIFVSKFTTGGALVGSPVIIGTDRDEEGYGITVDLEGNVYVTGTTNGDFVPVLDITTTPNLSQDTVLIKFDGDLNEQWRRQYGQLQPVAPPKGEIGCSVAVSCSGTAVYVAGHQSPIDSPVDERGLLLRYSSTGDLEWVRFLGGPGTAAPNAKHVGFLDVAVDLSGGVYVVGQTDDEIDPGATVGPDDTTAFFARYDDSTGDGTFQWAEQIEDQEFFASSGRSIAIDRNQGASYNADIYVAGNAVFPQVEGLTIPEGQSELSFPFNCGMIDSAAAQDFFTQSNIFAARYTQTEMLVIKGDVNGDGFVNLEDVAPFVDKIGAPYCVAADVNCDGFVDTLDIGPFLLMLTNPCN